MPSHGFPIPEPLVEERRGPCDRELKVCGSPKWCNQGDGKCIGAILETIDPDMVHMDGDFDNDPLQRYHAELSNDIYSERG